MLWGGITKGAFVMATRADERAAAAVLGVSLTVLCTAPSALCEDICDVVIWCDDFDNYATGVLIGQDCTHAGCPEDVVGCEVGLSWQTWDFSEGVGFSPVVDTFSNSAPHALEILGGTAPLTSLGQGQRLQHELAITLAERHVAPS